MTGSKAARKLRSEPRSRTFTGCGTCRGRHLKCDEARPTCSSCRRLSLACQGYAPRLLWVSASAGGGRLDEKKQPGNTFRYPLFTEEARVLMSIDTVHSLGKQSTGDALNDLDSKTVPDADLHVAGPFGVFRAFEDTTSGDDIGASPRQDDADDDAEHLPLQHTPICGFTPFLSESLTAFSLDQSLPFSINDYQISDCNVDFATDFGRAWDENPLSLLSSGMGLSRTPSPLTSGMGNSFWETLAPKVTQYSTTNVQGTASNFGESLKQTVTNSPSRTASRISTVPSPRNGNLTTNASPLPSHTAVLLQYLKAEVLESTNVFSQRGMSPWKILLLPCALETVAEISLWNTTSCARRSILSTLLAKGAFHLSKSKSLAKSEALFWLQVGKEHQQQAQIHLQSALQKELETEGKYVEMLMAILSVGVVAVYYHGPHAIRKLLLDAERLIRIQGLPATKTVRHRILHHMYTHLRLILETTNVAMKPIEMAQKQAAGPSELIEYSIPRSFGIKAQNLGDLDLNRQKPEDVGYNDIHLDVTGMWQVTLYPEIYGIPETLMSLLSQTVSLVNEKPRLEVTGMSDPAVSSALSKHIRTLEQQIWSWTTTSNYLNLSPSRLGEPIRDRPHMESMILAMHQALIIFFYRRVYNMSVMVIQSQVQKALEFIEPCLHMGDFDSDFSVSIGWSAFIAACEAATPELKELGLKCLEALDDDGMFLEQGKPSTVAKAVWEQREKTNDFTFGWPDLMSQQATAFVN